MVIKDETVENLKNEEKFYESNQTCQIYNYLTSELKAKLWKKKYDFKRSNEIVSAVDRYLKTFGTKLKYNKNKYILQNKDDIPDNANKNTNENGKQEKEVEEDVKLEKEDENVGEKQRLGLVTDEDLIKLRKGEKKKINWKNKLYLGR